MHPHLSTRIEELKHLALAQDFSLLTRRFMDLATDFDLPPESINRIIDMRVQYNQMLYANNGELRKDFLMRETERILNDIEGKESGLSNKTFEELQQEYLPTARINGGITPTAKGIEEVCRTTNLGKTYPPTSKKYVAFSLKNINVSLFSGEITGIVGENGNGKTTLLNIISGDLSHDIGELSYPFLNQRTRDWYEIKKNIICIPQQLPKWNGLLKENLHFALANRGIFGRENEDAVTFIIHRLGLTRYEDARWNDISSGYKLRFALAKALLCRPKLLILDEPLANLDINAKTLFMQDLRLLSNSVRYPVAILMSSQQLHEIESVVDNIVFLRNGESLYNGKMDSFEKDRTQNTFELSGDFSRINLQTWLNELAEGTKITETGQAFIVETPLNIEASHLLGFLATKTKLDYFRDISQSTKKLFQQ